MDQNTGIVLLDGCSCCNNQAFEGGEVFKVQEFAGFKVSPDAVFVGF